MSCPKCGDTAHVWNEEDVHGGMCAPCKYVWVLGKPVKDQSPVVFAMLLLLVFSVFGTYQVVNRNARVTYAFARSDLGDRFCLVGHSDWAYDRELQCGFETSGQAVRFANDLGIPLEHQALLLTKGQIKSVADGLLGNYYYVSPTGRIEFSVDGSTTTGYWLDAGGGLYAH